MSMQQPRPLEFHNLDSLCDELVSGRAVVIAESGKLFSFNNKSTRAVFSWYSKNRAKWSGQNRTEDVEAIVDSLDANIPEIPPLERVEGESAKQTYRLNKIRIFRFAGLQSFGELNKPPSIIEFAFPKALSVTYGRNGSGKSALLSAIAWCICGYIYRSQRGPELGSSTVPLDTRASVDGNSPDNEASEQVNLNMAAITPIPSAKLLDQLFGSPLPTDTWVEIELIGNDGKSVAISRKLQRNARGQITETTTGFEHLSLDSMSLEVGTRLPALIQHINLAEVNDWGKALASLTGLRALDDLVVHVRKSCEKLKGDLKRKREKEIAESNTNIQNRIQELKGILELNPAIAPEAGLPNAIDPKCKERVESLWSHFQAQEAVALEAATTLLGEYFDPTSGVDRTALRDNVAVAINAITHGQLNKLKSVGLLSKLKKITPQQLISARELVDEIVVEAVQIADLAIQPELAARKRLYAHIGQWLREHDANCKDCPVCDQPLDDRKDVITGNLIEVELNDARLKNDGYLAQTLTEWERKAIERLRARLPAAFIEFQSDELPSHPIEWLRRAFSIELFEENNAFGGVLQQIKELGRKLSDSALENPPPLPTSPPVSFPQHFAGKDCDLLCRAVLRIIDFVNWRTQNEDFCKDVYFKVINPDAISGQEHADYAVSLLGSLGNTLNTLKQLVDKSEPLEPLTKAKVHGFSSDI